MAVPFFRPAHAGRLINLSRLGRIGVVMGRGIARAKEVFTHKGLHFVLLTATVMVFASAGLVLIAERNAPGATIHNYGQALWWAVVTVTTVGYGDKYPVTGFGQGIAVVVMVVGIGLIGVLTATVASYFVGQDLDKAKEEREQIRPNSGPLGRRGKYSSGGSMRCTGCFREFWTNPDRGTAPTLARPSRPKIWTEPPIAATSSTGVHTPGNGRSRPATWVSIMVSKAIAGGLLGERGGPAHREARWVIFRVGDRQINHFVRILGLGSRRR